MSININDGVSKVGVHLIPKDKIPPLKGIVGPTFIGGNFKGDGHIAANAGVLELRCVINRQCPFTETDAFDDTIILNEDTIFDFPKEIRKDLLETVSGTEGVFLKREYNYRHNYIVGFIQAENFDGLIEDPLTTFPGDPASFNIAYQSEQEWSIVPSVFTKGTQQVLSPSQYLSNAKVPPDFTQACDAQPPIWRYTSINKQVNHKQDPDTGTNNILMPQQTNASICGGVGVHWRLDKRTDLFQGEDFFVEFHRGAPSTDINSFITIEETSEISQEVLDEALAANIAADQEALEQEEEGPAEEERREDKTACRERQVANPDALHNPTSDGRGQIHSGQRKQGNRPRE